MFWGKMQGIKSNAFSSELENFFGNKLNKSFLAKFLPESSRSTTRQEEME